MRIETRFNHVSVYVSNALTIHEDMREIVSLVPYYKRGKLDHYLVTFSNGKTLGIFPSLENPDQLLAKLRSYLPATQS
ncbi:MAG: hypothetical protein JST51_00380 [Armatimonadetes bacterium]|nr:hypothetical protein [Armatimonadota bacterium]